MNDLRFGLRLWMKKPYSFLSAVAALTLGIGLVTFSLSSIAGYPVLDHPALVFLAAVAFLGTISLIAILIPAVRGARVDPMEALRYE